MNFRIDDAGADAIDAYAFACDFLDGFAAFSGAVASGVSAIFSSLANWAAITTCVAPFRPQERMA